MLNPLKAIIEGASSDSDAYDTSGSNSPADHTQNPDTKEGKTSTAAQKVLTRKIGPTTPRFKLVLFNPPSFKQELREAGGENIDLETIKYLEQKDTFYFFKTECYKLLVDPPMMHLLKLQMIRKELPKQYHPALHSLCAKLKTHHEDLKILYAFWQHNFSLLMCLKKQKEHFTKANGFYNSALFLIKKKYSKYKERQTRKIFDIAQDSLHQYITLCEQARKKYLMHGQRELAVIKDIKNLFPVLIRVINIKGIQDDLALILSHIENCEKLYKEDSVFTEKYTQEYLNNRYDEFCALLPDGK